MSDIKICEAEISQTPQKKGNPAHPIQLKEKLLKFNDEQWTVF